MLGSEAFFRGVSANIPIALSGINIMSLKYIAGVKCTCAPFSHLVGKRLRKYRNREARKSRCCSHTVYGRQHSLTQRQPGESGQQGGDLWYWSVYSALLTNIRCFTNRTNSHSGPSTCINESPVLELMDLTSPVTRKVLRL